MSDEDRFTNPYAAASMLEPGEDQLRAVYQFLEDEQHRLNERLNSLEAEDGSIPSEVGEEWSMVKGKLDQTRLLYGLVVQSLLASSASASDE
jgi:hypothetical protein